MDRPPRRVVTGVRADGRSAVVADGPIAAVMTRPGGATISEIWRMDQVPAVLADAGPLIQPSRDRPGAGGPAVERDIDRQRPVVGDARVRRERRPQRCDRAVDQHMVDLPRRGG